MAGRALREPAGRATPRAAEEASRPFGDHQARGRPSQHGVILGEALADIAKAGRVGIPDFPEMCATCAFREGSLANQMAATGIAALDCVLGIDPDDFGCHHGMRNGEPTKLCAGFLAAQRAPWPVVLAAVQTVAARLASLPEHDAVQAEFDEWAGRVDPEGRMDNYQWGRARLRDSDGSPKGGDACGSVHDSAGRNGIAQSRGA